MAKVKTLFQWAYSKIASRSSMTTSLKQWGHLIGNIVLSPKTVFIFDSNKPFSGSKPGDESVDGEEGESESFLDDDDEADGLVRVLEDAGLSDEHENPADDEDSGDYQLVLEDPLIRP